MPRLKTNIVGAVTVAITATVLMLPLATQAAKPPKTNGVTLTATPQTLVFGQSTVLGGKLSGGTIGGQAVDVQANSSPSYAGFLTIVSVLSTNNGTYTATVKPAVTTRYRVTAKTSPPLNSAELSVGVRIRVGIVVSDSTPRRGTRIVFSGRAYPAHDGQLVSIQRRRSTGSFATVARTRLRDDGVSRSKYRRSLRISSSGVYRVRVASGDTDHLTGTSRRRTITVH